MRAPSRWWVVLSLLMMVVMTGCAEPDHSLIPPAQPVDMRSGLSPGDTFEVRVFGEDDIGGLFQVQADGSIDFPLIGRVMVQGETQAEIAAMLEQALGQGYLREPNVTVVLTTRENLEVSVLGEVEHPGTFPYIEQLSLVQAVSDAGGLTDLAHAKRVKLTRKTQGEVHTYELSLKAITDGRERDIPLQPGDIIFVPEAPI